MKEVVTTAWCLRCETEKPLTEFYVLRNHKGLHRRQCKTCCQEIARESYLKEHGSLKEKIDWTTMTSKKCTMCGEVKPIGDFRLTKHGRKGHRTAKCKACNVKEAVASYRKRKSVDPEAFRLNEAAKQIQRSYGLSWEQYCSMLKDQRGVCAICGQPEATIRDGRVRLLGVDHDHNTGRVRALLCNQCNHILGQCHDDRYILQRAIDYLTKYKD